MNLFEILEEDRLELVLSDKENNIIVVWDGHETFIAWQQTSQPYSWECVGLIVFRHHSRDYGPQGTKHDSAHNAALVWKKKGYPTICTHSRDVLEYYIEANTARPTPIDLEGCVMYRWDSNGKEYYSEKRR